MVGKYGQGPSHLENQLLWHYNIMALTVSHVHMAEKTMHASRGDVLNLTRLKPWNLVKSRLGVWLACGVCLILVKMMVMINDSAFRPARKSITLCYEPFQTMP